MSQPEYRQPPGEQRSESGAPFRMEGAAAAAGTFGGDVGNPVDVENPRRSTPFGSADSQALPDQPRASRTPFHHKSHQHLPLGSNKWLHWCLLVAIWSISAWYTATRLDRGWVPHDEGTLAHAATRILLGELPHRDFQDAYTGGLSVVNAAALHVFGEHLLSLRVVLFLAFCLWVPTLWYIATRLASPWPASAAVLLAVMWSVPTYSAAMPSWYNLFLATFGAAALFRYLETDARRWLLVAGIAGGVSILVKISGIFFVGGVLLFLVYREQQLARRSFGPADRRRGVAYSAALTATLLLLALGVTAVVRDRLSSHEWVTFVVPTLALVAVLIHEEWTRQRCAASSRWRMLCGMIAIFGLGLAAPLVVFALPYAWTGSVPDLWNGVLVLPASRLIFASLEPPHWITVAESFGYVVLLLAIPAIFHTWRQWPTGLFCAFGLATAIPMMDPDMLYQRIWDGMRALAVLVVVGGAILLVGRPSLEENPRRQAQFLLLFSLVAMVSLVQYPFAAPVYFFYVAPLAALAGLAIVSSLDAVRRRIAGLGAAFLLIFAIFWIHPGFLYNMGQHYAVEDQTEMLDLPRGRLRVSAADKLEYETVSRLLSQHARNGFTWVGPDAPELYFLTGLRNPTPILFDFFVDPDQAGERILAAIDSYDISVIAINRRPGFSRRIEPRVVTTLVELFPHAATIGRFEVRWK